MRWRRGNREAACLYGIERGSGYCEWCVEYLMWDGIPRDEAIRRVKARSRVKRPDPTRVVDNRGRLVTESEQRRP